MSEFIVYILQVNLYLVAFYLFYWLVLRGQTSFQWNRIYLMSSSIMALLLPFTAISLSSAEALPEFYLEEVVIGYSQPSTLPAIDTAQSAWSVWTILGWCYITGVFLLGFRTLWWLYRMFRLIQPSSIINRHEDYTLVALKEVHSPFSFFRFLFWNPALDDQEKAVILAHEITHIKESHSIDILWLETLKIIFWFNPICYRYKRSIQLIHEYIADANAVKQTTSIATYGELLVQQLFGDNKYQFSNTFFEKSAVRNRLIMLQKNGNHRHSGARYWMILPLILLLFCVGACEKTQSNAGRENKKSLYLESLKSSWDQSIAASSLPNQEKQKLRFRAQNVIANFNTQNHDWLYALSDADIQNAAKQQARLSLGLSGKNIDPEDEYPSIQPEFPGGIKALFTYIGSTVSYPKSLRSEGVEGTVHVEFVVNKNGTVGKAKIARSVHPELDSTAIRAVRSLPKWVPGTKDGEPADIKMTLPIRFALD